MQIRIIPNFMAERPNLSSPPLPLNLSMHKDGGHMRRWFGQLGKALQSAQTCDHTLEPILRFLGTEEETVDININLVGEKRRQCLIDENKHLRYKDYFKK